MADADPKEDPFEGLRLDEEFIRNAPRTELSADERRARAVRIDADRRRIDSPETAGRRGRAPGRARARSKAVVVLVVVLVVGAALVRQRGATDRSSSRDWTRTEDLIAFDGTISAYPPPPDDLSDVPLGSPPPIPSTTGSYGFIRRQPGSDRPVTYDPCRPIHIVVNNRTRPPGAGPIVREAVTALSRATGLRMVVEGETVEQPAVRRRPVQVERYGDRWAPVLLAWSDEASSPQLAGTVAGVGGSLAVTVPRSDELSYVSGVVVLDGPDIESILDHPGGVATVRTIVEHELGHLLGLDHVDDPSQIMFPTARPEVVALGSGDRAGLARLGGGPCRATL